MTLQRRAPPTFRVGPLEPELSRKVLLPPEITVDWNKQQTCRKKKKRTFGRRKSPGQEEEEKQVRTHTYLSYRETYITVLVVGCSD